MELEIDDILSKYECYNLISEIDNIMNNLEFGCGLCYQIKNSILSKKIYNILKNNEYFNNENIFINDTWYYTKYNIGMELGNHMDGSIKINNIDRNIYMKSEETLLIYLNNDFTGGKTYFMSEYGDNATILKTVIPSQGKALILKQNVWHKGEIIKTGTKYLLRTDILRFY